MFDNLTDRLSRTLRNISGRGRLTEDNVKDTLREVRMALLEADVALPVVREFINRVKEKAVGHEVNKSLTPGQEFVKIVRNELVAAMGEENQTLNLAAQPPAVVLMAGLQGAGKTTSVGKLGKFLREKHTEWAELLGSASAIVEVVRAEGYAAKNGNVAELLPEKAVFWARDVLKSTAVRSALPWVFLCAFAPRLGKGFGAFTWEGLSPEEYAFAAELLANAHPRGLKALLRHAAEADAVRLAEEGKTVLFSTHELGLAMSMCDSAMLIDGGRVLYSPAGDMLESGKIAEVFGYPAGEENHPHNATRLQR